MVEFGFDYFLVWNKKFYGKIEIRLNCKGFVMNEQTAMLPLSARGLCRNYADTTVVHEIDLQLRKNEVLGLLGPNGAGKSTIIRMLTGNLAPSKGSVKICGIDLTEQPRIAKTHLGYLPEVPPLYQELTVNELLRFVAQLHRMDKQALQSALDYVKEQCGLSDRGSQLIGTLSKGFQQRVGIAQAIIHRPKVIVLDEPTVGLDPNQTREVRQLIDGLATTSSVVFSTHILSEVENICDRVNIIHQGRLVYDEYLTTLKDEGKSLETIFMALTGIGN